MLATRNLPLQNIAAQYHHQLNIFSCVVRKPFSEATTIDNKNATHEKFKIKGWYIMDLILRLITFSAKKEETEILRHIISSAELG